MMKAPLLSPLPQADFASIATDLRILAVSEGAALMPLEEFVARWPGENVQKVLEDVRRTAALIGRLAVTFEHLAPHEAAVRQAVAEALDAGREAQRA